MNKSFLIVFFIIAIVVGFLIFGNGFADARDRRRKREKPEIKLYDQATNETVNLTDIIGEEHD